MDTGCTCHRRRRPNSSPRRNRMRPRRSTQPGPNSVMGRRSARCHGNPCKRAGSSCVGTWAVPYRGQSSLHSRTRRRPMPVPGPWRPETGLTGHCRQIEALLAAIRHGPSPWLTRRIGTFRPRTLLPPLTVPRAWSNHDRRLHLRIHDFQGCFLLDALTPVTPAFTPMHAPGCPPVAGTQRGKKRAVEEETTPVGLTYS